MAIVEPTTGQPAAEPKPFTDRDRYEMNRNQLLHNYERAVENAQSLAVKISTKRNHLEQLAKEIESLESDHATSLVRIKEEEAKLVEFIKTRRHYEDA